MQQEIQARQSTRAWGWGDTNRGHDGQNRCRGGSSRGSWASEPSPGSLRWWTLPIRGLQGRCHYDSLFLLVESWNAVGLEVTSTLVPEPVAYVGLLVTSAPPELCSQTLQGLCPSAPPGFILIGDLIPWPQEVPKGTFLNPEFSKCSQIKRGPGSFAGKAKRRAQDKKTPREIRSLERCAHSCG